MKEARNLKQLTVRVPESMLRALKVKAATELRTITGIIEDMLRRELKETTNA